MADVIIRDLRKVFGSVEVLHGVNVDIGDGEFVVLVGPSGCGKSTLLRMIAGLEDISSGTIRIGGQDVSHLAAKERDVAMVFQNYALYPHMTVYANMAFSLRMRKAGSGMIAERVEQAAKILNLTEYLKRYPKELSGGQRQRVAMGRAIVRDPKVFLFDEPLSNLDAKLRVAMRTEIKALHQRLRTTTVFVTHDQIEAMTMADRIVVMRDGVIEQVGSPLDLYDQPSNQFVAGFIGSPAMNFIEGSLRASAGGARFEAIGGAVLSVPIRSGAEDGRRVTLGIRPEHLSVAEGSEGISGRVIVIEPTGAETHIHVNTPVGMMTAVFHERISLDPGTTVSLSPKFSAIHLFDTQSGQRLG